MVFSMTLPRPLHRSRIQTVYQLIADIQAGTEDFSDDPAISVASEWIRSKVISDQVKRANLFEHFRYQDNAGIHVEWVPLSVKYLWAARLQHPDTRLPGRVWTTDLCLFKQENCRKFAIKLTCSTPALIPEQTPFSTPAVVRQLAESVGINQVYPIKGKPIIIESIEHLQWFHEFLTNPLRRLPVVALSQPDKNFYSISLNDFVLDEVALARATIGVAHIVLLPWDIAKAWTALVGKEWSVYLGATRTYYPGLDLYEDDPDMHPRKILDQILFWQFPGKVMGEQAFQQFLLQRLRENNASQRLDWTGCQFVNEANTTAAEIGRAASVGQANWQMLYEEEIESLKKQIEDLKLNSELILNEAAGIEADRDLYRRQVEQTRIYAESLKEQLRNSIQANPDEVIDKPNTLEDINEWVIRHIGGRLELHPRAMRGAKKSLYEDNALIFDALLLLATHYRDGQLGMEGASERFEARMKELGLACRGTISKSQAGQFEDTYQVLYPPNNSAGKKRTLEWHLCKGDSRDERRCLRIYFFWDQETSVVVVGWLPNHLRNNLS